MITNETIHSLASSRDHTGDDAIDTTLYYTFPGAPAQEDMGAISSLLEQLLNDLERGE